VATKELTRDDGDDGSFIHIAERLNADDDIDDGDIWYDPFIYRRARRLARSRMHAYISTLLAAGRRWGSIGGKPARWADVRQRASANPPVHTLFLLSTRALIKIKMAGAS